MKDLEKILKQSQNERVIIPQKFTDTIKNSLYQEKVSKWRNEYMKRKILTAISVCACCIIVTGVAFQRDISAFIQNIFGPNSSDGVRTAVENGYVENLKAEYQNADGIEINVDSFMMDDFNFAMNFNLKLDDRYNIEDFSNSVEFDDLKIIDETGKTVFVTHQYDTNLEYRGSYSFYTTKNNEHELTLTLSATGNPEAFPKSKHLTVSLSKITTAKLIYINNIEEKERSGYQGNWTFEIDVPKEFYNREAKIYKAKKCNDSSIDINKIVANVSNTAFKISIPEIKTDKIDYNLLHTSTPKSIYDKIALQKEYVETSDGKRFETAQRSDGDGGYGVPYDENIIVDYHQTFNLTNFDATDEITVHIFTNKGEEITIELERTN